MQYPNMFQELGIVGPDQFHMISMTRVINYFPTPVDDISRWIRFTDEGVTTNYVSLDKVYRAGHYIIGWSAVDEPRRLTKRGSRSAQAFVIPYLGIEGQANSSEVDGVRETGSITNFLEYSEILSDRLGELNDVLTMTENYHKFKVVTEGIIPDPDDPGTPLVDLNAMLGRTPIPTVTVDFSSETVTDLSQRALDITEDMADRLAGVSYGGFVGLMGKQFAKAMLGNQSIHDSHIRATEVRGARGPNYSSDGQPGSFSRSNLAFGSFNLWDIEWTRFYEGNDVNILLGDGTETQVKFMDEKECKIIPMMPQGTWRVLRGPDNRINTVNRKGIPRYASSEPIKHNRGHEMEAWMRPFYINERPDAVYTLRIP